MNALWQFLASSTAPWWASLFGVALGSVATYFITRAGDNRKFKRDDQARWDEEIRSLYMRAAEAARPFAAGRMLTKKPPDPEGDANYARLLRQSVDTLRDVQTTFELIGDDELRRAISDLVDAAQAIQTDSVMRSGNPTQLRQQVSASMANLLRVVRRTLRVEEA